ncbi:MAG: undecaprenyl-diphosphate phosphatase [Nanoarchaeota archaeon]|nr:undecaprenyl-diphosphate phosphatase [Nanoarchaeota archaeon]
MVSYIDAIVFSLIQGLAEWLPISSSGHLAIFHNILGYQNLSYDVFLHFASILAVIILFRKDILKLLNLKYKENLKYIGYILIAIIPAGIIGVLFKDEIESFFSSLYFLGVFFIISGILIYSTRFFKEKKEKLDLFDSIFIGIFQAIAIVPGISRSGATISGGVYRGLKKETAAKFSFLIAIPVILGASLMELEGLILSKINYGILTISFILTFVISIVTIKILIRILNSDKFYLFGAYNFILGIIVLIWSLVK